MGAAAFCLPLLKPNFAGGWPRLSNQIQGLDPAAGERLQKAPKLPGWPFSLWAPLLAVTGPSFSEPHQVFAITAQEAGCEFPHTVGAPRPVTLALTHWAPRTAVSCDSCLWWAFGPFKPFTRGPVIDT